MLAAVDIKNTRIQVADIQKEYSSATDEFQGFFKAVTDIAETDPRLDEATELLKQLIAELRCGEGIRVARERDVSRIKANTGI